jgi:apolipoprotein N-acyltransferase
VKSTDDSPGGLSSTPRRDRPNQWRVTLWSLIWAISFIAVTLAIEMKWLPFGMLLAGVTANAILGIANVLAYRRLLDEADELRRKIEMEALAFAFGAGVVGGMIYWLLVVMGAVPGTGFIYIFAAMMITYSVGVVMGHRKYS